MISHPSWAIASWQLRCQRVQFGQVAFEKSINGLHLVTPKVSDSNAVLFLGRPRSAESAAQAAVSLHGQDSATGA